MKNLGSLFRKASIYILALFFIGLKITALYSDGPSRLYKEEPKEVWITVFIHGIMSIKPHINWSNFMNFFKDKVEGSLYEKTVELMREDSFFYKNQPMQYIGLHRVEPHLVEGNSSASMAYIYDEVLKHYGIAHNNFYYTFGWSGLLSSKARYKDSNVLYEQLEEEITRLKALNYAPKVRLVGYSHGGNIILNLAAIKQNYRSEGQLYVDESILIGTPIIRESDFLINDEMFGRIYNIYSLLDRVQPLDVFAPNQAFSERVFKPRKDFELPEKLVQIQLKVTRCNANVRKSPDRFKLTFDYSNPSIVFGRTGLLRDVSPGHSELWFFGWTPVNYRESFPMYPLPAASLAPVITYHANKIRKDFDPSCSVIADIRPEHDVILFRPKESVALHSTVPYIPKEKVELMREAVMKCKPELYTNDIYQEHVKDAVKRANMYLSSNEPPTNEVISSSTKTVPYQVLTTGPVVSIS